MSQADKVPSFLCPHLKKKNYYKTLFIRKHSSLKRAGTSANPPGMALPSQAPERLHTARSDDNSICAYVHLYAQSLAPDLQYTNKTRLYPAVLHVFLHLDSNQNRFIPFQCQIQFCSLRSHLPGTPILFHFLPLIILTARTSGVSRRYTIEHHLAKTSRSGLKASVYIHCLNQ